MGSKPADTPSAPIGVYTSRAPASWETNSSSHDMLPYRLMTAQSACKNNARGFEWAALKVPLTPLPHHSGVSEGLNQQSCRTHSPDGQPTHLTSQHCIRLDFIQIRGTNMGLEGQLVQGDISTHGHDIQLKLPSSVDFAGLFRLAMCTTKMTGRER